MTFHERPPQSEEHNIRQFPRLRLRRRIGHIIELVGWAGILSGGGLVAEKFATPDRLLPFLEGLSPDARLYVGLGVAAIGAVSASEGYMISEVRRLSDLYGVPKSTDKPRPTNGENQTNH